jgi:GNAT superfamily N-acetyltransferase
MGDGAAPNARSIRSKNRSDVRLRRARLADAPRIAALAAQLGYPSPASEVRKRLERIRRDDNHFVSVAEIGGKVVGWVHAFVKYSIDAGPRAEIGGLVVDASRRRAGLGKLLMGEAEEWARSRELEGVYLRSNVLREPAHAFYEAIGFRKFKSQHCFLKLL